MATGVLEPHPPHVEELPPAIGGTHNLGTVADSIGNIAIGVKGHPKVWWLAFGFGVVFSLVFVGTVVHLLTYGTGVWGLNIASAWGFAIINFVWWIGIGHAGTLISAILLLLHQRWRTSINRFAEAMTIFAVMCAGVFPLLHTGRPWLAYWLFPAPYNFGMWPQFRSPLEWDVFAVSTYFTVSLIFWYVGLIPDFATLRDAAPTRIQKLIYGLLALGWRGSAYHWRRYEKVYLILAGISTPLVFSVHSIVSFDFAVSIVPLWHATIFPPFFVIGAIFSGFAMVLVLAIPLRSLYGLKDFITDWHIDNCAKVMLATGLMVSYGYFSEVWFGWYSHSIYEQSTTWQRLFGPYGWSYWVLIFCNFVAPQVLWVKKWRMNAWILFAVSIIALIGMWFERYVIVITLTREYLPSMWGHYAPTMWDWLLYLGTFGIFFFFFMLFVRYVPMISITEMRELLPKKGGGQDGHSIAEGPP
ncbi:MAG: NrfD/PsrC family molybdoenzyme membrane anchor subunit [Zavarzinella sp.]